VVIRLVLDALAKQISMNQNAIAQFLLVIHLLLDALAPPLKLHLVAFALIPHFSKVAYDEINIALKIAN